ncbi:hypothetical protein PIB30_086142 [Stylosanthes scabra]|uniref:Uncharacterized protein n=1 Tax=Stylosanthes scabra TaxID=79078 RepID=A0ABU6TSJ3_9FABA|nr:hypothetical protein [Stylosanthes scabra]
MRIAEAIGKPVKIDLATQSAGKGRCFGHDTMECKKPYVTNIDVDGGMEKTDEPPVNPQPRVEERSSDDLMHANHVSPPLNSADEGWKLVGKRGKTTVYSASLANNGLGPKNTSFVSKKQVGPLHNKASLPAVGFGRRLDVWAGSSSKTGSRYSAAPKGEQRTHVQMTPAPSLQNTHKRRRPPSL